MILAAVLCCSAASEPGRSRTPFQQGGGTEPTRTQPSGVEADPGHWGFTLEPFLWLAGISGDGSADDSNPPIDIGQNLSPFGSIDGGFLLAFEARAPDERYSLLADGLFLSLADREGSLETDTDAFMFEAGAGLPLRHGSDWEAIAGLRYVDLKFGTDVDGGASASERQNWVDPWVGARGRVPFAERWSLGLRADVGGFGVGTQFTWQAGATVRADLGKGISLDLGYRAISLDFDDGDLEYDAIIRGPLIALAFAL
jgi:hypothetical protein